MDTGSELQALRVGWTAPPLGRGRYRRLAVLVVALLLAALAAPAPVARASEEWCEIDPVVVVKTPQGNVVPVYVTSAAPSPKYLPQLLTAKLSHETRPARGGRATVVWLEVDIPSDALSGDDFRTRSIVSTGPLATGTILATADGLSGRAVRLTFDLDVP